MKKKILIINGPNLNFTGHRQTDIYGVKTFDHFLQELNQLFPNFNISYFQSNVEGEIINQIHHAKNNLYNGIILNAGGFTHSSVSIADAISAIELPVIEVHMSNIYAREKFRHNSLIAPFCKGSISGFGLESYKLALKYFE